MDKEKMVKEVRDVLTSFMKEKFNVNIAMLVKDIDSDTYTFLLSAKGFNNMTPFEATKLAAQFFYERLNKESFRLISRINIVHTYDSSIDIIFRAMYIKESITIINNCNLFGVLIKDAILFESHSD